MIELLQELALETDIQADVVAYIAEVLTNLPVLTPM